MNAIKKIKSFLKGIGGDQTIDKCSIVACENMQDLYLGLPTCRQCTVNTVRRLLDGYGDSPHLHTFKEVEEGILNGKDARINSAYLFWIQNLEGMVRMENALFKERGYDPEQYK